jgi:hypothetical protein
MPSLKLQLCLWVGKPAGCLSVRNCKWVRWPMCMQMQCTMVAGEPTSSEGNCGEAFWTLIWCQHGLVLSPITTRALQQKQRSVKPQVSRMIKQAERINGWAATGDHDGINVRFSRERRASFDGDHGVTCPLQGGRASDTRLAISGYVCVRCITTNERLVSRD